MKKKTRMPKGVPAKIEPKYQSVNEFLNDRNIVH